MAAIVVISGPQHGLFAPLGTATFVIGRDEALRLQLEGDHISRKHARIRFDAVSGCHSIQDMESRNGTFVNGQRIEEATALGEGDEITIGDATLIFSLATPKDKANALEVAHRAGQRNRRTRVD